jgi:hypothetical protein
MAATGIGGRTRRCAWRRTGRSGAGSGADARAGPGRLQPRPWRTTTLRGDEQRPAVAQPQCAQPDRLNAHAGQEPVHKLHAPLARHLHVLHDAFSRRTIEPLDAVGDLQSPVVLEQLPVEAAAPVAPRPPGPQLRVRAPNGSIRSSSVSRAGLKPAVMTLPSGTSKATE